jgi:hypothetical protein
MDAAHPKHRVTEPTYGRCHKVYVTGKMPQRDELVNSKDIGYRKELHMRESYGQNFRQKNGEFT